MKTKKSVSKRIRVSASGKLKFKRVNKRHHLSLKASSRKLRLRKGAYLSRGDQVRMEKCIPYGLS